MRENGDVKHICNKAEKCGDRGCKHRTEHYPNFWCECPQQCNSMRSNMVEKGHHVAVECQRCHA